MLRSLVLLAALAAPLSAAVATGSAETNSDWWRDGQTAPWSFVALDANRDGLVSQGEMATARMQYAAALKETRSSLIAAVDLDQSGKLSRYEAAEASKRWLGLRDRAREMAVPANDKNHDGKLTEDESSGLEKRIAQVFARYGVVAVGQDQGTGNQEAQAAIAAIRDGKGALFTLCDRSKDGMISVPEANLAFDLLAATAGVSTH